jgi:polysaccharide biosynthesis protein PslH
MRILMVTPYVPSRIRVRPFQIVKELAARHDVTVLAAAPGAEIDDVPPLRKICRRVEAIPLEPVRIARNCLLAPLRREPLQAGYCRSPALTGRLQSLLATERFDVVHVEHLRAAHLIWTLPLEMHVVYDAVDSISLLLARTLHGSHSAKQRLIALVELAATRMYERRILERVGIIAVTSDDDARAFEALRRGHGARLELIPNGVDLDYFRPMSDSYDRSSIVISGKMSYHANATAALYFAREILPRVQARHPEARLRIVGSAPTPEVLALARDPGIEVTGYVPDIRPAIAHAAVAVCPVTVKVGIQNKILEAMALGVPVVSTAAGASGLRAEPGSELLVGRNPEELAQQISAVLGDRALRQRLALAGRTYVEAHHRWSSVAMHFERLYAADTEVRAS